MNNLIKDTKLFPPSNHSLLDSLNYESVPSEDFVVSKNHEGEAISFYGDLIWDFTSYHPDGKPSSLLFIFWDQGNLTNTRKKLIDEIKHIFYILIWLRDKNPLSIGTLRNYLTIVRQVAKFAENKNCSLKEVIGNSLIFLEFIRSQNSGWFIETFSSLLILLNASSYQKLAIKIVEPKLIRQLQKQNKQYRLSLNQHAPIPSRIYSEMLKNLILYLDDWEQISNELLQLLIECYQYKLNCGKKYPNYQFILNKVSEPLKNFLILHSGKFSLRGMNNLLTETQCLCKILIQAFTGMRDDEALYLPYQCLKEIHSGDKKHFLIQGRTTKFNHGQAKATQWVTSLDGVRAVKVAQNISSYIYQTINEQPVDIASNIFNFPLFISTTYFEFTGNKNKTQKYQAGTLYSKLVITKLIPKIEEADINELEQIDPHRSWRSEESFFIGKIWPFTTHQLRRSLALYAQRSGLVSLPSLRRQLQHITNEMTSYYSKGSSFAKNLIDDNKSHFANEWQQTQAQSNALGYIFNVLMSDAPMYGGHIHWIENTLKNEKGMIVFDRKQTLERFKRGDISYKETIIGGCTKVGTCNFTATNWLQINCLKDNCRHLIVSLPKLEKVITAQEKMIKFLDVTSLEYRTEVSHLQILKETKCKIIELKGAK